jgi:hypothetical protein
VDWALLAASIALVAVTGGLVYFTWGLVDEARKTRAEIEQTRDEMEEARRLGVRPHLTLEPVLVAPTYATLALRNLGPGAARNVTLQLEFEPVGDVREFSTPVMPTGRAEQFLPPKSVNDLDAARAAGMITRVTGSMEDLYGERLRVDLVFEWAPWIDKLTKARRRTYEEPLRPIVKALEAIEEELTRIRNHLGQQQRQPVDVPPE